jgi:hypothetical protein
MQFSTLLEHYYFEKYILEVAIATLEHGGVTSKVDTFKFLDAIDAWGVPKYPDRTHMLAPGANLQTEIRHFIEKNENYLREADSWLGTWIDPGPGICYLDITTICFNLEEARRIALICSRNAQRKIIALYNFKHAHTVFL